MNKLPKTKKRQAKRRKKFTELIVQFIKLQIAGNVPFWGTYILFAFFDKIVLLDIVLSLFIATIAANAVFFYINKHWVFTSKKGKRKTTTELIRFIIFMSFSAVFSFVITWQLYEQFAVTPYIGQFVTAIIATLLTFIGLRFWVFAPSQTSPKS